MTKTDFPPRLGDSVVQRLLGQAADNLLEQSAALLVVFELVEAGAGWRQ
jgi:hypothetical protein